MGTEKKLEDYDVNQLEPYDGTKFYKEKGESAFYDVKEDVNNKKVVMYDLSLLEEAFHCLIHYRTGHVIRRMIFQVIKERFKIFDEVVTHVCNHREKKVMKFSKDSSLWISIVKLPNFPTRFRRI